MKVKRYRFRLMILLISMVGGLYFLVKRLENIQVDRVEEWRKDLPTDSTETVRIPPIRGEIVDRNGTVLATNEKSYELEINLEKVNRFYHDYWIPSLELERVGRRKDGMLTTKKETDIADIAETTILSQLRSYGFEKEFSATAIRSHYNTHKGLVGFKYSDDLSFEQFSALAENSTSLPGVEVSINAKRNYPYGSLAGHLLGRTKGWAKGNIPEYEKNIYNHYIGDSTGDSGVEKTMDEYLRGIPGKKTVKRGPKGVYIGEEIDNSASSGANVQLTIDAGLQSYVEGLLTNVGRGGITVIDVETGEVLALATVPTINQNDYLGGISQERYDYYRDNKAAPFLNNAVLQHQPGSVYKLPVALAAAQAGLTSFEHNCIGYETYGRDDRKIRCWLTSGHGSLGMSSAIQRSCNPYFMALANRMGSKRVVDVYGLLGFGYKTGIQITREDAGMVPGSLSWKRNLRPGATMTQSNLANLAIGQQDSSASTLQVAAATAAIANDGVYMRPRIIKSVIHPEKGVIVEDRAIVKVDLSQEGISKQALKVIQNGMWRAANEEGGTASRSVFSDTIEIAAKTGTAQTVEFKEKSNNAWTTAYAPYDNPRYAVCAVVIGGTSGGKVAGPLVRETMKALFAEKMPEPKIMEDYPGHTEGMDELILTSEFSPIEDAESETNNEQE